MSLIQFSGLAVEARDLLCPRKHFGIIPTNWDRYQFKKSADGELNVYQLDRWLVQNIAGRWASYMYHVAAERAAHVILRFQFSNDALLFKLKDGENEAFE